MIPEISSRENPKYKELKKLSKEKSSYIFIEGKQLFLELINSNLQIKSIYIDKKNQKSISKYLTSKKNYEFVYIKNDLISSLYTTENLPLKEELLITVSEKPHWSLFSLFDSKTNLLFLEQIQDPGNLGTIIRSAIAFNIGGIILTKNSADPYNTKTIRASAGAVFKCPIVFIESKPEDLKSLRTLAKSNSYKIIATAVKKGSEPSKIKLNNKNLFVFGNEGKGISEHVLNIADDVTTIPHSQNIESLNVGVAASLMMWESYKNRRAI